MKQFKTLFGFEMKKIAMRKSTWIILGLIIFYFVGEEATFYIASSSQENNSDSAYTEEEEFNETMVETMQRDIKNAKALSGRKLDDSLIKEWQDYLNSLNLDEMSEREKTYALDRYRMLKNVIANYTMTDGDFVDSNLDSLDLAAINKLRQNNLEEIYDSYELSDTEKKYWQSREEKVDKPITLQYEAAYEQLSSQDIRMCMIMVTFLIAVVMSPVFAEEHSKKTDQLILSSRLGRKHVYFAKLAAGTVFTILEVAIIMLLVALIDFDRLGLEGFNASVLQVTQWYSTNLTHGQLLFIMLGIYFLAAILTAIMTMVISERLRNSVAAISVIVITTFVPVIVVIPSELRLLSQILCYFPVNLLDCHAGLTDLRMVSIGGLHLVSLQFAPILYVIIGVVLVIVGKRIYCKYQVA